MKRNLFKAIVLFVLLDLFGGAAINMILRSGILQNSKISLSVIIGTGVLLGMTALICRAFRRERDDSFARLDQSFEAFLSRLQEQAAAKDRQLLDNCISLEERNRRLEHQIRVFPLRIALGYQIFSVVQDGGNPFVDTCWIVAGNHNGSAFYINLTRVPHQDIFDLIALIGKTRNPEEIRSLDQYSELYSGKEDAA